MTSSKQPARETHAGAEHFVRTLAELGTIGSDPRILVAGCGNGHEALYIHKNLGGSLVGVDIRLAWDAGFGDDVADFELRQESILDLPFDDSVFDAVFYHHVIEHVSDAAASLRELARVLRRAGVLYVGTPNRHRVFGYLGALDVTVADKVRWNIADYRARLSGRFRNELGAHAGFSERELADLLGEHFHDIHFLTADYLRFKYSGQVPRPLLKVATNPTVRKIAAPSVYAVAKR